MHPRLGSFLVKPFGLYAFAVRRRRSCSPLLTLHSPPIRFSVYAALLVAAAGAQPAADWTIDTVAGTLDRRDGGPAAEAWLFHPRGVAADGAGNLYIADTLNHRIRRVDAAGTIATVAGTGESGFSGDGGPAVRARLNRPADVAVDGAGNLYIVDSLNHCIRQVDAAGTIATVAGSRTAGFSGDGGPAVQAQLFLPRGAATDGAGNLYIADTFNHRIRRIDAAEIITTVAGTAAAGFDGGGFDRGGFSGDGGPAAQARLMFPQNVAADGAGSLYIADSGNHRIRRIDAAGAITTFAGTGESGFSGDGGPATQAQLSSPGGAALDEAGNLYIADNGNQRIRRVDAAGTIATVAGTGESGFDGDGGPVTQALLSGPRGVAVDKEGNFYIADSGNHRIRRVDSAGIVTTVAGTLERGDGGPASQAQLNEPAGAAVDETGNLYIADTFHHRIRRVDSAGIIATAAGTGEGQDMVPPVWIPVSLAAAGSGAVGLNGDGVPAVETRLTHPYGVAADEAGNLYVADTGNNRIRRVNSMGIVTTVAGTGDSGFDGDGGPASQAQLSNPLGVAADYAGNFYIADTLNHCIRRVDSAGIITTVAGIGRFNPVNGGGFSGDGGPAGRAQINSPGGVALDGAGNLYIADTGNNRIRRLTPPAEKTPLISSGGVVLAAGTPVVKRISPNSLISVFGQDFAPQGTLESTPRLDAEGKIAANLAAVCLEIDGKRAPLSAVAPTQINAQVPHDLTLGQARVAAIRGCGTEEERRSPAATVAAAAVSPAFFNFLNNPDGRNPLAALHGEGPDLAGAPGLVPGVTFTPVEPGEVVSLFGTGFGATEPPLEAGRIARYPLHLANEVSFTFGGVAVPPWDVFYAGAASCCAGLYRFSVRVPPGLPDGAAPVIATVRGVSTPEGPFLTVRRR